MTRDDIIKLAREACDADKVDAWHNGFWTVTQEELERFAALVAAAEREATLEKNNLTWVANCQHLVAAERKACAAMVMPLDESLADAIRARGNK